MADQAVIRIILQDGTRSGTGAPYSPTTPGGDQGTDPLGNLRREGEARTAEYQQRTQAGYAGHGGGQQSLTDQLLRIAGVAAVSRGLAEDAQKAEVDTKVGKHEQELIDAVKDVGIAVRDLKRELVEPTVAQPIPTGPPAPELLDPIPTGPPAPPLLDPIEPLKIFLDEDEEEPGKASTKPGRPRGWNLRKDYYDEIYGKGHAPYRADHWFSDPEYDNYAAGERAQKREPKFREGGPVPGRASGTDTVPAWLTPGEFVVKPKPAEANRGMLEEMNKGDGALHRAKGGPIGGALTAGAASFATSAVSADSDPSEPLAKLGEAASLAGQMIPGLGTAAVVAGEALKGFAALMKALDQTADKYGQYNPEIASAQAVAEIHETMGDFRRSQQVGKEMAEYVMARSDMQQKFEDTKIKLMQKIVPIVVKMLKVGEGLMPVVEGVASIVAILIDPVGEIMKGIQKLVGAEEDKNREKIEDPAQQLFNPLFATVGTGKDDNKGLVPNL